MTETRIYKVTDTTDNTTTLVEAVSRAQAVKTIAADRYEVHTIKPLEVGRMMSEGVVFLQAQGGDDASD